jgi:hypothetical protein
MGNHLVIYNFEDVDSSLTSDAGYYYWPVDFGEGGETEVAVDVDSIIDGGVISPQTETVTVDTDILAGEVVNQGQLYSLIKSLCDESSTDEVFDMIVCIEEVNEDG